MKVVKRNGQVVEYHPEKIWKAIKNCFYACKSDYEFPENIYESVLAKIEILDKDTVSVEEIQDIIEDCLMGNGCFNEAKEFILYREKHKNARFIKERIDYMDKYVNSSTNASTSSETDANANVAIKNVANLEAEVYKITNRIIQRKRMVNKLQEMFPEVADQYIKDLDSHIIYVHDEASTPTVKNYCEAVSLYPLLLNGTGDIDGITPGPPKNLSSFCGQFVNLAFLLSSQCKGAVAFGGLFVAFNLYCVKEFGEDYYIRFNQPVYSTAINSNKTIQDVIVQYFQQLIWTLNQPAGNRAYQSPFTNVSYYDKGYFTALFNNFYYPDGTQPKWEAISYLQKLFMKTLNKERLTSVVAFPVETMCLLTDGNDVIDKEYKDFTAEMYAEGHSFFTYLSDNPNGLSSCCRLRSEIQENVFSFTNGLSGIKTGSCNVITLNINRIIQDWYRTIDNIYFGCSGVPINDLTEEDTNNFKEYLISILERIYKYHIAFKTMLYDMENKGMLTSSKAGYIDMESLYSTIGVNGINEAAMFLGIDVSYNKDYKKFCNLITGTIKEQNKLHSSRKFKFNQEFVPAEDLGRKNFEWDKEENYYVPNDGRVLYNSYFYNAHDNTSVLDKLRMHGKEFTSELDGGVGCHINLDAHLSKKQYLKLINFAIKVGTSYFTFNIPNTKCDSCGFITKHNVDKCPKCSSTNLTKYTRVIGYLRATKNFSEARQIEEKQRIYFKEI